MHNMGFTADTSTDLLREIETDLGWATDYRVQKLLKEWGWREG